MDAILWNKVIELNLGKRNNVGFFSYTVHYVLRLEPHTFGTLHSVASLSLRFFPDNVASAMTSSIEENILYFLNNHLRLVNAFRTMHV